MSRQHQRTITYGEQQIAPADRMTADWMKSNGTYIAGRAELDGVDQIAAAMERKWGADRLRLLVPTEWREKFDRQRLKLARANRQGTLDDVRREAPRMIAAWRRLDALAEEAGAKPCDPDVLEIALETGELVAIVRDIHDSRAVQAQAEGRRIAVYSHDEIARMLASYRQVSEVKVLFPGAEVVAVRSQQPLDPLTAIEEFDDSIPF